MNFMRFRQFDFYVDLDTFLDTTQRVTIAF